MSDEVADLKDALQRAHERIAELQNMTSTVNATPETYPQFAEPRGAYSAPHPCPPPR